MLHLHPDLPGMDSSLTAIFVDETHYLGLAVYGGT